MLKPDPIATLSSPIAPIDATPQSLGEVETLIWSMLKLGVADRRNLFHTPSFVTLGVGDYAGLPQARSVVLRGVDRSARQLRFHTDYRTAKVAELAANPNSAFLFYDPDSRMQLRVHGHARVHYQDDVAKAAWDATRLFSRRCYLATLPSGSPSDRPVSGLPDGWERRNPNEVESLAGWPNFCAVVAEIVEMDWLLLEASGQRRARFRWNGTAWQASWLAP
ncbi:MAG: pyridoxamine 5'-phosphate oxidase [Alphaproteobacteria bacterium]|nr:pyridoxamine 5'-phosphate oxidase [Alphaproteobacteria bacterium]